MFDILRHCRISLQITSLFHGFVRNWLYFLISSSSHVEAISSFPDEWVSTTPKPINLWIPRFVSLILSFHSQISKVQGIADACIHENLLYPGYNGVCIFHFWVACRYPCYTLLCTIHLPTYPILSHTSIMKVLVKGICFPSVSHFHLSLRWQILLLLFLLSHPLPLCGVSRGETGWPHSSLLSHYSPLHSDKRLLRAHLLADSFVELSSWILSENVGNEQSVALLPLGGHASGSHVIIVIFIHIQVPPDACIEPDDACACHSLRHHPSLFRLFHSHRHCCRVMSAFLSIPIVVYYIPGLYNPPKRVAAFFIPFPVFQKLKRADEQQEIHRTMETKLQVHSTFETIRFRWIDAVRCSDVAGQASPLQENPRNAQKKTSHFAGTGRRW